MRQNQRRDMPDRTGIIYSGTSRYLRSNHQALMPYKTKGPQECGPFVLYGVPTGIRTLVTTVKG